MAEALTRHFKERSIKLVGYLLDDMFERGACLHSACLPEHLMRACAPVCVYVTVGSSSSGEQDGGT
jgi:hypothetical protein